MHSSKINNTHPNQCDMHQSQHCRPVRCRRGDRDREILMRGETWHAELGIEPAVVQDCPQTVGGAAALGLARLEAEHDGDFDRG